jgi:DNA-binding transcriptional MerR regulator
MKTTQEVCALAGISRSTLYKYANEIGATPRFDKKPGEQRKRVYSESDAKKIKKIADKRRR